jgi:glutamate-1-semialdehyde aminotransferase
MDRHKLTLAMKRESERFLARTPKSAALFEEAKKVMPGGVPMSWMSKWPGAYPVVCRYRASGA